MLVSRRKSYFISHYNLEVNARNKLQQLIIQKANDELILKEIFEGANVYSRTKGNESPLLLAISNDLTSVVNRLLAIYDDDIQKLKLNGWNHQEPVLIAFGQQIQKITAILEKFSPDNAATDILIMCKENNNSTPIIRHLPESHSDEEKRFVLEIINELHENGTVDVNFRALRGETLFHVACHQGYTDVLVKLMKFGCEHDINNDFKISPFDYACMNNHLEAVKMLYKECYVNILELLLKTELVFKIAVEGNFEVFEYLLKEVLDSHGEVNVQNIFKKKSDFHENTLLDAAILADKHEFAHKCLNYDPDVGNITNSCGENILHSAVKSVNGQKLSKVLIRKFPELLTAENINEWTPLHYIATKGWIDLQEIYAKFPKTKEVFFKNPETGRDVLFEVVQAKHFMTAEFLLEMHYKEHFTAPDFIIQLLNLAVVNENSLSFIKRLQKLKHFDPSNLEFGGNYAMMLALKEHRLENFGHLMATSKIKDFNQILDREGNNLLFFAIWKKPEVIVDEDQTKTLNLPEDQVKTENYKIELEIESYSRLFHALIAKGVSIHHKNKLGLSLLHAAVIKGNFYIINELLNLGVNPNELDNQQNSVLHYVETASIFKLLITKVDSRLLNQQNNSGSTPIHNFVNKFKVDNPNTELLKEFLGQKPNLNIQDEEGSTVLHLVNDETLAKILIQHGANVDLLNELGENLVHTALKRSCYTLAKYFLKELTVDFFAKNSEGVSYLGYLVWSKNDYHELFDEDNERRFHRMIFQFRNDKELYGRSIISAAIYHESDLVFKLLECHDLDVTIKDASHSSLLHKTCANFSKHSLKIVQMLLEKGVGLNDVDDLEKTALIVSIECGNIEIAMYLMNEPKIDLNIKDIENLTALHYAAKSQNIKIVCGLLLRGANHSIEDNVNKIFYHRLNSFNKRLFKEFAPK